MDGEKREIEGKTCIWSYKGTKEKVYDHLKLVRPLKIKFLNEIKIIYTLIIRLLRIQYKTPIAEACDYFNSTLEEIARLHRVQY